MAEAISAVLINWLWASAAGDAVDGGRRRRRWRQEMKDRKDGRSLTHVRIVFILYDHHICKHSWFFNEMSNYFFFLQNQFHCLIILSLVWSFTLDLWMWCCWFRYILYKDPHFFMSVTTLFSIFCCPSHVLLYPSILIFFQVLSPCIPAYVCHFCHHFANATCQSLYKWHHFKGLISQPWCSSFSSSTSSPSFHLPAPSCESCRRTLGDVCRVCASRSDCLPEVLWRRDRWARAHSQPSSLHQRCLLNRRAFFAFSLLTSQKMGLFLTVIQGGQFQASLSMLGDNGVVEELLTHS